MKGQHEGHLHKMGILPAIEGSDLPAHPRGFGFTSRVNACLEISPDLTCHPITIAAFEQRVQRKQQSGRFCVIATSFACQRIQSYPPLIPCEDNPLLSP